MDVEEFPKDGELGGMMMGFGANKVRWITITNPTLENEGLEDYLIGNYVC